MVETSILALLAEQIKLRSKSMTPSFATIIIAYLIVNNDENNILNPLNWTFLSIYRTTFLYSRCWVNFKRFSNFVDKFSNQPLKIIKKRRHEHQFFLSGIVSGIVILVLICQLGADNVENALGNFKWMEKSRLKSSPISYTVTVVLITGVSFWNSCNSDTFVRLI